MRFVLLAAAVVVVVILLVFVIGALLPVAHTASRSAQVPATPERVYAALANLSWRKPDRHGDLKYEIVTAQPPTRLVTRIADRSLPFGGEWEYTVAPVGTNRSQVTIVERGEVYNPAFRFLSRFVFGYHGTMDAYLRELAAHLSGGSDGR